MSRFGAVSAAVLERVKHDPGSLIEVFWKLRGRMGAGHHRRRVDEYALFAQPPATGLAALIGVAPVHIEQAMAEPSLQEVLAELDAYTIPDGARHMGGAAFLEACYAVVRTTRPAVVVETGVAHGYSTSVLLQALEANGGGRLYSIDLAMFRPGTVPYTGGAVPQRLRSPERWELRLGSDRKILPGLLRRTGPIDLLFYDSDTSYRGMRHTWERIWACLRPGGVLLLNMVQANDALIEFAEAHRITPIVLPQPKRAGAYPRERKPDEQVSYLGALRKPLA